MGVFPALLTLSATMYARMAYSTTSKPYSSVLWHTLLYRVEKFQLSSLYDKNFRVYEVRKISQTAGIGKPT